MSVSQFVQPYFLASDMADETMAQTQTAQCLGARAGLSKVKVLCFQDDAQGVWHTIRGQVENLSDEALVKKIEDDIFQWQPQLSSQRLFCMDSDGDKMEFNVHNMANIKVIDGILKLYPGRAKLQTQCEWQGNHIRVWPRRMDSASVEARLGYQLLHSAEAGCLKCVMGLLDAKTDIGFRSQTCGYSALDFAAWGRKNGTIGCEMVESYLREKGATHGVEPDSSKFADRPSLTSGGIAYVPPRALAFRGASSIADHPEGESPPGLVEGGSA